MFECCPRLSNIVISDTVTSIGYMAFYGCYSMTNIDIPPSVKKIRNDALWRCKKLKIVRIGNPKLLKKAGLDEKVKNLTKE